MQRSGSQPRKEAAPADDAFAAAPPGRPAARLWRYPVPMAVALAVVMTALLEAIRAPRANAAAAAPPPPTLREASAPPGQPRCCGPSCRADDGRTEKHYDERYFAWQTKLGKEKANSMDWNAFLNVSGSDVVADMGAGGGHILATLNVSRRIAVEINDHARDAIRKAYPGLIELYKFPEDLPDNALDLVYSTSAIEHFECPVTELREIVRKLKVRGRLVVGVKNEGVAYAMPARDDNIDQHLFTWGPQQLHNLVKSTGVSVEKIDPPIAAMLHKGREWSSPDKYTTGATFVYLWAHGRKLQ